MSIKLSRLERFLRGAQMNTKPKKKKKKLQTTEFVTPLSVHFCRLQKVEKKRNFHPEKNKSLNQQKMIFFFEIFSKFTNRPPRWMKTKAKVKN